MKNLTLENITKVCNGIYHGPQEKLQEEVTAITTDSRKVEKGGLFVPVVGERVDAHRFIPQVMEAGALATLSERVLEGADYPYIQVESSLQEVKDSSFLVKDAEGERELPFDYGFVCLGMRAQGQLFAELSDAFVSDDVEILNIGDSKRARRIIDGTLEGRNILNTLTQMGYLQ